MTINLHDLHVTCMLAHRCVTTHRHHLRASIRSAGVQVSDAGESRRAT
jgi:hypothetical protein